MENINEILKMANDSAEANIKKGCLKPKDKEGYIAGYIDGFIDKAKKEMIELHPTINRQF